MRPLSGKPTSPDEVTARRLKMLANGFPVIPVTSPSFKIFDIHAQKLVPLEKAGKAPLFTGWNLVTTESVTPEIVRQWPKKIRHHGNTGILCGLLSAADIDVLEERLAAELVEIRDSTLGNTPLHRVGRAPKSLGCYRVCKPLPKMATTELYLRDGTKAQVEILGLGQQFVADGIHPETGRQYTWPDRSPLNLSFEQVPEVSEDQLRDFLVLAEEAIRRAGGSEKRAARAPGMPPLQGNDWSVGLKPAASAADWPRIRSALQFIPAEDRSMWVKVGAALHQAGEGGNDGFEIWCDWSESCPEKYEYSEQERVWKSFKLDQPRSAATGTIFWLAKERGWKPVPKVGPDNDAIELTEHQVALEFKSLHQDELLYCHHTAAWFIYTGTHWEHNETGLGLDRARRVAVTVAAAMGSGRRAAAGRASFARGVEIFAQRDPILAVTSEAWDRDPWLLGTPGGTVDLRTGRIRPADPADRITMITAVAPVRNFDPDLDCSLWLRFLGEATGGDTALIRFIQQWCGYCLTGVTLEQALVFLFGLGGNGKSVFLNVLAGILGTYARHCAIETFSASKHQRHLTEVARLRGARLAYASETEAGVAWAESRIKEMTGGDKMTANFMRRDHFEFRPQFKLTIVGNNQPVLHNVDDAMKRRINIIPFTRKPKEVDKQLEIKLRNEWPGILAWMIEGCSDWQKNGLVRPELVRSATNSYFEEQDTFQQWLEDCCEVGAAFAATNEELLASWSGYSIGRNTAEMTPNDFRAALQGRVPGAARIKNTHGIRGRGFLGLRVLPKPKADDFETTIENGEAETGDL
jgi:putative DNA primase/helicase